MEHKNIYIGVVVLVLVMAGGIFFAKRDHNSDVGLIQDDVSAPVAINTPTGYGGAPVAVSAGPTQEFVVTGGNFYFTPNTITVKKGDKVKIILKNKDGFHDLKIDEFNVATHQIKDGEEDSISFVADKVGSFEYYCSVGKHRDMGMLGTLVVTE